MNEVDIKRFFLNKVKLAKTVKPSRLKKKRQSNLGTTLFLDNDCTEINSPTIAQNIHTPKGPTYILYLKTNVKNNRKTTIPTFKPMSPALKIEIETFPHNQTIPKFFTLTPLQTLGACTLSDPHSCSLSLALCSINFCQTLDQIK